MSKFITYFNGLTADTDPQSDSDFLMEYDTSAADAKKVLISDLPFLASGTTYLTTDTKLDDLAAPDDNTDLNSDTDSHGLLPKLSGDSDTYLTGVGTWEAVSAAATKLDDLAAPDDNTDLNATTSAHGLLPKLGGDSDTYLNGDGEWTTPAGGGFTTGDIHMVELFDSTLTTDGNFSDTDISQDYDHLIINLRLRSSVSAVLDTAALILNNDSTAGNYKFVWELWGPAYYQGTADGFNCMDTEGANSTADAFSYVTISIPNYTSTIYLHEMFVSCLQYRSGGSGMQAYNSRVIWEATGGAAITQITIQPDGYATDKFVTGSRCQIYGVKTEA
jgi:hypothetical protein